MLEVHVFAQGNIPLYVETLFKFLTRENAHKYKL